MDEKNVSQNITDAQAMAVYESDKKSFEDFVQGQTDTIDFARIQRLVLNELNLKKSIGPKKICGVTRGQIKLMTQHPERYGDRIIALMEYMYQKSGYMRRLIDYFSHMPKLNYYVDTEVSGLSFFNLKEGTIRNNYMRFCAQASKFNLSNIVHDVFKRLYLHDACFAFLIEDNVDISYFFINPRYCKITGIVGGNVYKYAIDKSLMSDVYIQSLPTELQTILNNTDQNDLSNLVDIPYENGFCIKYNNHFLHLFPPMYPMIENILAVEDFEDLAKTKAINDAYKLLILKVPMDKNNKVTMDDKLLSPFVSTALNVVNDNIGVLPYPGDVEDIEFSSSSSDDNDMVSNVISQMYAEQGVSESLMSGASSGAELKLSITNDSGDTFRIYRMLENWIDLQMKVRGFVYRSYHFIYKIADITIFNWSEVIDEELKLAQASLPNKSKLCAIAGITPGAVIGNTTIENVVFKDIFDSFIPLKSSYTTSGDEIEAEENNVGAPEKDETELSPEGEDTRERDANNPDDRGE